MALQIRRGSETELSTFTPAIGELIYDTTNKKLYVGDGTTVGGIDVSIAGGIGGPLSSTINLNTYSIVGFGDITIDGSIAANSVQGTFEGSLQGDVIGNLVGDTYGNLVGGSVFGSDSSVLVDAITNTLTGDLTGKVLSSLHGTIVLDNSLNTPVFYGTVSGDLLGDVNGNLYGSVFGVDSSTLVDTYTGHINSPQVNTNNIRFISDFQNDILEISSDNNQGILFKNTTPGGISGTPDWVFQSSRGTLDSPADIQAGDVVGSLRISGYNAGVGRRDAVKFYGGFDATADMLNEEPASFLIIRVGQNAGNIQQASFDFTGTFTVPAIKTGSYITGGEPSSPSAGMIIFDSTLQKYKGYVDDTGLAGGGASNNTPGWIILH